MIIILSGDTIQIVDFATNGDSYQILAMEANIEIFEGLQLF